MMTGSAGGIGTSLRKLLPSILSGPVAERSENAGRSRKSENSKAADLALQRSRPISKCIDGHFLTSAAIRSKAPGTDPPVQHHRCYNLFEAARRNVRPKRVVFAFVTMRSVSTNPRATPSIGQAHRCVNRAAVRAAYGASAICLAMAVGALVLFYADKHGLSGYCLVSQFLRKAARITASLDLAETGRPVQLSARPSISLYPFRSNLYGVVPNETHLFDNHTAPTIFGYARPGRAETFRRATRWSTVQNFRPTPSAIFNTQGGHVLLQWSSGDQAGSSTGRNISVRPWHPREIIDLPYCM